MTSAKLDEVNAAMKMAAHARKCFDCSTVFVTYALVVNFHGKVPAEPLESEMCNDGKQLLMAYNRVAT